jgi:hypothetical protein
MKSLKGLIVAATFVFLTVGIPSAHAKSFGIRAAPIGLLIGFVDASVDIGMGNLVLSPRLVTWNISIDEYSWSIQGGGASVAYHFNGAFTDGLYLGGGYIAYKFEVSDDVTTGSLDTAGGFGRVGYEWNWDSFYLNLGAEFLSLGKSKVEVKNNSTGVVTEEKSFPALGAGLDFGIGFAF